jgi:predicted NUDIX family phosphoesterase
MGDFLDAAHRVLQHEGKPLTPKEITKIAVDQEWLETTGATPHHTMRARLSDDILHRREKSLFMRVGKSLFALREWDRKEYMADRFQKALLDEDAVVFDAHLLESFVPGAGLHTTPISTGRDLLAECRPMLRRVAESDPSVIQLVSAFILQWNEEWLTYKRTKRLPESRLHGEYSVNFGGHLTPGDFTEMKDPDPAVAAFSLFNMFDPEYGRFFLSRELKEEVILKYEPQFRYRGILYDDRRPVSRQHLAIVYDVLLLDQNYKIGERGFLMDDKFESLAQIESRIDEFENWSELLIRDERRRRSDSASHGGE